MCGSVVILILAFSPVLHLFVCTCGSFLLHWFYMILFFLFISPFLICLSHVTENNALYNWVWFYWFSSLCSCVFLFKTFWAWLIHRIISFVAFFFYDHGFVDLLWFSHFILFSMLQLSSIFPFLMMMNVLSSKGCVILGGNGEIQLPIFFF